MRLSWMAVGAISSDTRRECKPIIWSLYFLARVRLPAPATPASSMSRRTHGFIIVFQPYIPNVVAGCGYGSSYAMYWD